MVAMSVNTFVTKMRCVATSCVGKELGTFTGRAIKSEPNILDLVNVVDSIMSSVRSRALMEAQDEATCRRTEFECYVLHHRDPVLRKLIKSEGGYILRKT